MQLPAARISNQLLGWYCETINQEYYRHSQIIHHSLFYFLIFRIIPCSIPMNGWIGMVTRVEFTS